MSTILDTPRRVDPAPPAGRVPRPVWLVLLAASLPMFMATLDNLVMTSALPVIADDLHPSVEQLQWFVNAYTLSFATLMIPAAAAGDRWGRRRVFAIGIALFALGSAASALATTPELLIAARAFQGIGGAVLLPLSLTLLAGAVAPAQRAMAIGIWGGVSGLGVALGPVVGGAVVESVNWQAIFWLNVPVAALSIPLIYAALTESRGHRQPFDLLGLLLAGAGILLGVWGIIDGNDRGWSSVRVLFMLSAAVVLIAAFILRESRTDHPIVPLRLFRHRDFAVANIAGFLFTTGVFGVVFLLSQYLQIAQGFSPLEAGVRTLPWTAAPLLVAPVAGLMAGRIGVRPLVTTGLSLLTAALGWMAASIHFSPDSYTSLIAPLVLAGVGMGMTFAPLSTAVLADVPDLDHATASSVNATIREVGVALGIAVMTAVFLGADGAFTPTEYGNGIVPAVVVGTAVVAAAALSAIFFRRGAGRSS